MSADNEELPLTLSPMLATASPLPTGPGWVYESKWDGIRGLIAIASDGTVRVRSRAGNDNTEQFPELQSLREPADGHALLLDGEIVAFDDAGMPSFNRLQSRLGVIGPAAQIRSQQTPVLFVMFDLLHLDGFSTRRLPFEHRRTLLERLDFDKGPHWHLATQHEDGAELATVTRAAGLEGVVAKRLDGAYYPGTRSKTWIKHRHLSEDEFVIGGWVPGEGRRTSTIGALLLGVRVDDQSDTLQWVGKAGTGFTDAELARLRDLLAPLVRPTSPFDGDVGEKTAVFVAPRHSARVAYGEYSPEGLLRFPSYKGLVTGPDSADPDSAGPDSA
jgi:bifunctional non-homologous end joining protein LigD